MEQAKNKLLRVKGPQLNVLEETSYGDILEKVNRKAAIYINGMMY
jgi:hypothetical protein